MDFHSIHSQITSILSGNWQVIVWNENGYFHVNTMKSEAPEFKSLLIKTINGIGSVGHINVHHVLHSYLHFRENFHYTVYSLEHFQIICFSENPRELSFLERTTINFIENQEELRRLREFTKLQFEQKGELQTVVQKTSLYTESILLNYIHEKIPQLKQLEILVSPSVLHHWMDSQSNSSTILKQLNAFINISEQLGLNLFQYSIQLGDIALETEKISRTIPTFDRTTILLDRYEQAAEKALSLGLEINGKNIASLLTPPISPAAVTDALKKNQSKITLQLKQHPTNWPLIRKGLRPLQFLHELSLH